MLSTRSLFPVAVLGASAAVVACADPGAAFSEFNERIPDAGQVIEVDAEPVEQIPDVTGDFLLAISVVVSPDRPLQFEVQTAIDGEGEDATIDLQLMPLNVADRTPAGQAFEIVDTPIDATGRFVAVADEVLIPADANPITGTAIEASPLVFEGAIRSTDRYCGAIDGQVVVPVQLDLAGSTFSAIRISSASPELPDPESACPGE